MFGQQDDQTSGLSSSSLGGQTATASQSIEELAKEISNQPAAGASENPPTAATATPPAYSPAPTSAGATTSTQPAAATPATAAGGDSDDLLSLKQQALQELTPLVGRLDQSPDEKFRTTMMMIQASDNKSLLKTAYDAARQITDEKARAQALLDIVNEINYFTQPTTTEPQA